MTPTEILLAAYDDSYFHEWESIESSLNGVTDEMSVWQPPGYTDDDVYPGDPAPGTIQWYLAHLDHCLRHYTLTVQSRTRCEAPDAPPEFLPVNERIILLKAAHNALRDVIAALNDSDLSIQLKPGNDIGGFVRSLIRHNAWHAGQIALVKRMYNHRVVK